MNAFALPLLAVATVAAAQAPMSMPMDAAPASGERLGTVNFAVSCSQPTQAQFIRGVALLHDFWYAEAQPQFERIAKDDPSCAMAHWGIAMSVFHQIWDRPGDRAMKLGWAEIQKAQSLLANTARERDYIAALVIFFKPGSQDFMARISAYSAAMGALYQKYPDDVDAGAFYALSLLASEAPDDTGLRQEHEAMDVLAPLFGRYPDNPGVVHYIIHSCDNPQMASTALPAARVYAGIASSSAHAVHMPSHIFARLGLWQEDIDANLKSVGLIEAQKSGAMYMGGHELHAMHFLLYAYLQTGQDVKAKQILEQAQQIIAAAPKDGEDTGMLEYYGFAQAHFPALYDLEMHHWADAMVLEPAAKAPAHMQTITYWAQTIGAARMGDVEAARRSAKKFDAAQDAVRKSKYAYMLEGKNLQRDEVQAWLAFAEKKNDEALSEMRQVADEQDKVGKAEVDIPAREMLADMLLESNQPEEALVEYEKSMKIDPNRFNELAGAARAAEMAHQPKKANFYYAKLLKNCDDGKHSERPELQRAKVELAKNEQ